MPIWILAIVVAAVCAVALVLQGSALGVPWWLALVVVITPLLVVALLAVYYGGDDTKIL